jgi:hypothetical protein
VTDRGRIGHVDVVVASRCLHVWMGGGKRGCLGSDKRLNRAEK